MNTKSKNNPEYISEPVAWEMAHAEKKYRDEIADMASPSKIKHPFKAMGNSTLRNELAAQAEQSAENTRAAIERWDKIKENPGAAKALTGMVEATASTNPTASQQIQHLIDMPSDELYKYEPVSDYEAVALDIAQFVFKNSQKKASAPTKPFIRAEKGEFKPGYLNVLHELLQIEKNTAPLSPTWDGEKSAQTVHSPLGFEIREEYHPQKSQKVPIGTGKLVLLLDKELPAHVDVLIRPVDLAAA